MIELNETITYTPNIVGVHTGAFYVSPSEQRQMLMTFLNSTHKAREAAAQFHEDTGQFAHVVKDSVSVEYGKVTKTKPRIQGRDYAGRPGMTAKIHEGKVSRVARNKKGRLYFTIREDGNRDGGWTALRLEGIQTFSFATPKVQAQKLAEAREALGATATAGIVVVA